MKDIPEHESTLSKEKENILEVITEKVAKDIHVHFAGKMIKEIVGIDLMPILRTIIFVTIKHTIEYINTDEKKE